MPESKDLSAQPHFNLGIIKGYEKQRLLFEVSPGADLGLVAENVTYLVNISKRAIIVNGVEVHPEDNPNKLFDTLIKHNGSHDIEG